MTGTIEVTQQDIDTFRESFLSHQYEITTHCPIALAAKRAFPGQQIVVGFNFVYINGIHHIPNLPKVLEDFAFMRFYRVKFNIVEAPTNDNQS